jgi:polyisoprenoid-binding protein YceI
MLQILFTSFILISINTFAKENCTYKFHTDQSNIKVTGFKFTEKTGVSGSIKGFTLNKNESLKEPKELLKDLVVTVDLMTLDTGNALRDNNLRETLFAEILNDSKATVTVKNVTETKIETELLLNGKTQPISFDYKFLKDGSIEAKGVFDAMKFALESQISSMKKRCGSLHTGSDGKSVTWTEFDLLIDAKIKQKCL